MEKEIKKRLEQELAKRIKDAINVSVQGDCIIIDIAYNKVTMWHYTINKLYAKVSTTWTIKKFADIIEKEYRKYVLSRVFY